MGRYIGKKKFRELICKAIFTNAFSSSFDKEGDLYLVSSKGVSVRPKKSPYDDEVRALEEFEAEAVLPFPCNPVELRDWAKLQEGMIFTDSEELEDLAKGFCLEFGLKKGATSLDWCLAGLYGKEKSKVRELQIRANTGKLQERLSSRSIVALLLLENPQYDELIERFHKEPSENRSLQKDRSPESKIVSLADTFFDSEKEKKTGRLFSRDDCRIKLGAFEIEEFVSGSLLDGWLNQAESNRNTNSTADDGAEPWWWYVNGLYEEEEHSIVDDLLLLSDAGRLQDRLESRDVAALLAIGNPQFNDIAEWRLNPLVRKLDLRREKAADGLMSRDDCVHMMKVAGLDRYINGSRLSGWLNQAGVPDTAPCADQPDNGGSDTTTLAASGKKNDPLIVFREMSGLAFNDVTLAFLANDLISVSAKGKTVRVQSGSFDLINRKSGGLNKQGAMLLGMAREQRVKKSSDAALKATISRIRTILRELFGLKSDPFQEDWHPHFTVLDKQSEGDERAKEDAHHESYDDSRGYTYDTPDDDDPAADYLK